jgi:hypothetical protein
VVPENTVPRRLHCRRAEWYKLMFCPPRKTAA